MQLVRQKKGLQKCSFYKNVQSLLIGALPLCLTVDCLISVKISKIVDVSGQGNKVKKALSYCR